MSKQELNINNTVIKEPNWLNALSDPDANYMRGEESKLHDEINKTVTQLNGTGKLITGFTSHYYRNLIIQSNAVTPNSEIDINIGSVVVLKDGLAAHITDISETVDITASGAGGLDSLPDIGVLQDKPYAIWVIWNDTTDTEKGMFSLSFTEPEMPSGYEYKRLVGYCFTDSSSNIEHFYQRGNYVEFGNAFVILADGSGGNATIEVELDINDVDSKLLGFEGFVNTVRLIGGIENSAGFPIATYSININQAVDFGGFNFIDETALSRSLFNSETEEVNHGTTFDIGLSNDGKLKYWTLANTRLDLSFYGAWLNL